MQDCEETSDSRPIRQGDVLKRVSPAGSPSIVIVMTADCDIANNKMTDAGLACVQVVPLRDYVLCDHATAHASRHIKRRFEKLEEWINKRWRQLDSTNAAIGSERVRSWIKEASVDEVERTLGLPIEDKPSFLRKEVDALTLAQGHFDCGSEYGRLDALRALQAKQVSRTEQLKTLFSSLSPSDLPLDVFFVSSVPGEHGVGFVAKLRALSFLPVEQSFTSMAAARDHEMAFLRVGRLGPTFRHGLAQQFGMLFARIGFPSQYESDREAAFAVVAEALAVELERENA